MDSKISGKYKANTSTGSHLKYYNNNDITDMKKICSTLVERFGFNLIIIIVIIIVI